MVPPVPGSPTPLPSDTPGVVNTPDFPTPEETFAGPTPTLPPVNTAGPMDVYRSQGGDTLKAIANRNEAWRRALEYCLNTSLDDEAAREIISQVDRLGQPLVHQRLAHFVQVAHRQTELPHLPGDGPARRGGAVRGPVRLRRRADVRGARQRTGDLPRRLRRRRLAAVPVGPVVLGDLHPFRRLPVRT